MSVGLVLLAGRYDWTLPHVTYAQRGYFSSAYMLLLFLPTLYYTLRALAPRSRLAPGVSGLAWVVLVLPYRWLGLDNLYYHRAGPTLWNAGEGGVPIPQYDWLPGALRDLRSMPCEIAFFAALAIPAGVILLRRFLRTRALGRERAAARLSGLLLPALFLLMLVQTWLHLSMRSPYTYINSFAIPGEKWWYTSYTLPDQQGAVNADYTYFRDLEEHFMGTPRETSTMFIRRALPFYLSSQFSYFFSPYYVWLALNLLLWFAAAACAYGLGRLLWNERIAAHFACLTACGSGFIFFVAQPLNYLAQYTTVIGLIYLFELLVVRSGASALIKHILFGGILSAAALTYDVFPMYVFLLPYAWVRQKSLKAAGWLLLSIGMSILVYGGFLVLTRYGLNLQLNDKNFRALRKSAENVIALLRHPDAGQYYVLTLTAIKTFAGSILNAFLIVPAVLAFFGLLCRLQGYRVVLCAWLAAPAFVTVIFLSYGQFDWGVPLASLPRFAYAAYPAVYALAAIFLFEIRELLEALGWAGFARWVPATLLATIFAINNVDVLGIPQLYYLFYFPSGGEFG